MTNSKPEEYGEILSSGLIFNFHFSSTFAIDKKNEKYRKMFMNCESYNAHSKKIHPMVMHKIIVLSPAHPYYFNVSKVTSLKQNYVHKTFHLNAINTLN